MKNWFNIQAANDGSPELLIEGFIGYWPVVAEEFRFQLEAFDDAAPVTVRIDSMGGDPRSAMNIYSMLKKREGYITVVNENNCLSSATIISCTGDKVIMHDLGAYMIHEPQIEPKGWLREDEVQSVADQVRIVREQMVDIYASFTGKDKEVIRDLMKATTWMNAAEALEAGFVTEIKNVVPQIEAKTDLALAAHAYDIPQRFLAGHKPKESHQQTKKEPTMSTTILNKLKAFFALDDDADETDVIIASKEQKQKNEELKASVEQLTADLDAVKKENADLKVRLSEQKQASDQAEEDEFEAELTAAVDAFKVKAGDLDSLREDFDGDLPGLKKTLARIPDGAVRASGTPSVNAPKTKGSRLVAAGSINETVAADLGVK